MVKKMDIEAIKEKNGLGRWGEHQHYNSDAVVEKALRFGETI